MNKNLLLIILGELDFKVQTTTQISFFFEICEFIVSEFCILFNGVIYDDAFAGCLQFPKLDTIVFLFREGIWRIYTILWVGPAAIKVAFVQRRTDPRPKYK